MLVFKGNQTSQHASGEILLILFVLHSSRESEGSSLDELSFCKDERTEDCLFTVYSKHLLHPLLSHWALFKLRHFEAETLKDTEEQSGETGTLTDFRSADWTERCFSFWQPLRDTQTEMWPISRRSSSSFLPLPLSLSVNSLSEPPLSYDLKPEPGYGIRRWLPHPLYFIFLPACCLSCTSEQGSVTGPLSLSNHYVLVRRKRVIVPAVCSDNDGANSSQVFPQDRGDRKGDFGWWDPTAATQPHPSVSVLSSPVAPLSWGPQMMVIISAWGSCSHHRMLFLWRTPRTCFMGHVGS